MHCVAFKDAITCHFAKLSGSCQYQQGSLMEACIAQVWQVWQVYRFLDMVQADNDNVQVAIYFVRPQNDGNQDSNEP